jgi:hypothetical protein
MTYTTPSTVTGADILSASLWNTQIRDNMEELRNPVSCEVCLTSNVTGYTGGQISWQDTNWDNTPSGMWAASPQPTLVTVPQDGIYLLTFRYTFLASPTTNLYVTSVIRVNGNPVDQDSKAYQFLSGYRLNATLTTQVPLSANDYIQVSVTPNYSSLPSSPNHTLYGASTRYSDQTRMSVTRISDV